MTEKVLSPAKEVPGTQGSRAGFPNNAEGSAPEAVKRPPIPAARALGTCLRNSAVGSSPPKAAGGRQTAASSWQAAPAARSFLVLFDVEPARSDQPPR